MLAAWWTTTAACGRGDHAAAKADLELALRLLHEPIGDPDLRRDLLGERDPGAGFDPFAELACLPWRIAYVDARRAGDTAAVTAARAGMREFAGRDTATIIALDKPQMETRR